MKATDKSSPIKVSAIVDTRAVIKSYYYLTKPGIIRGNVMTAIAGFLLAAGGIIDGWQLASMVVGLALIIAAGCVSNNLIDRSIDAKMARTSKRALVTGAIGGQNAVVFAILLGCTGALTLVFGTNLLTAGLAIFGYFAYVAIYGIAKRRTVHGTVVGSISGAIPPVVGYAAAAGHLDLGALLLFAILVAWQMPHFYAIAIYRLSDYQSAGLPVLPAVKGFAATKFQIIAYTALFSIAAVSLTIAGFTSIWYGIAIALIGGAWLLQTLRGLQAETDDLTVHWARQIFGSSLLVLMLWCLAIGVDSFL